MTPNQPIRTEPHGYYTLPNPPSADELRQYYAEKYYQQERGSYSQTYTDEELRYFREKAEQKHRVLQQELGNQSKRLLDVGCGEGFILDYFKKQGWDVLGLDYSEFGVQQQNPDCLPNLHVGDVYESLTALREAGETFSIIWLQNVLEHVIDPLQLLRQLHALAAPGAMLVVEVPNDFSALQADLQQRELVNRPYWVAIPDHISYFSRASLVSLAGAANWQARRLLADHPIDLSLYNPDTNYVMDKAKGRGVHLQRIRTEHILHTTSVEKTIQYYETLADMGLGRQITGFFSADPTQ